MTLPLTPSQTVGPYFGLIEMTPSVVAEGTPGAIVLTGTLRDGAGGPVPEGMLEVWQADAKGNYRLTPVGDEGFTGFGRCHTDDEGRFRFDTIKPGRVPGPGGGMQAPHINIAIFGAGLVKPVRTRVYFSDEVEANAADLVLATVPAERRSLLVGTVDGRTVTIDLRLQGEDETPFFEM
ncbi:MAG TPA: protocatechuate 3,4-dioxygenase subunit alpha [Acidimicrobiia bacterium]|nr:protocatechuate 3,4-dioxygenase subunit alpha [Acidimicrobiia bacterium]